MECEMNRALYKYRRIYRVKGQEQLAKVICLCLLFGYMLTGTVIGADVSEKQQWEYQKIKIDTNGLITIVKIVIRIALLVDAAVVMVKAVQGKDIGKGAIALLVAILIFNVIMEVFGANLE
jgi:hypothetical protein